MSSSRLLRSCCSFCVSSRFIRSTPCETSQPVQSFSSFSASMKSFGQFSQYSKCVILLKNKACSFGVMPCLSSAFWSAPTSLSNVATPPWPCCSARKNGVFPSLLTCSKSAARSSNQPATSTPPGPPSIAHVHSILLPRRSSVQRLHPTVSTRYPII